MKKLFPTLLFIFLTLFSHNAYAKIYLEGARDWVKLSSRTTVIYPKFDEGKDTPLKDSIYINLNHTMYYHSSMVGWLHSYSLQLSKPAATDNTHVAPFFSNHIFPELELYKDKQLLQKITFKKPIDVKSYGILLQLPTKIAKNAPIADDVYIIMPMTDKSSQNIRIPQHIIDEWLKILNKENILAVQFNTYKEKKRTRIERIATEADFKRKEKKAVEAADDNDESEAGA